MILFSGISTNVCAEEIYEVVQDCLVKRRGNPYRKGGGRVLGGRWGVISNQIQLGVASKSVAFKKDM